MSLGTANRDGGKTSESGHLRSIMKGYLGQVLSGLAVSQRGAGANMSVDIAIGDAIIPRSDGTYGHPAFNDAVLNQVITTADPSNPRRDILVMYIDYANAVSTGVSNNTNGVVKVKVVAGTPAGSPVDPTNAAIQSSVGASNPYIKLSRIRVGTGVTSIGNSVIDDLRIMASGMLQGGWNYDQVNTWVYVSATSFKIVGVDVTAQFPVSTKIQLYQGSVVAYFRVISAVFGTDTTVTIESDSVYTLANNIIDRPAFSYDQNPVGYPLAPLSALSMKSATNAGQISPGNSDNNFGTSNGVQVTFTVAQACNALVTIAIGPSSTSDFEFQPEIFLDGAMFKRFQPNASVGNASNRATFRGFSYVVPLTAGAHTLAAGATFASATALGVAPTAATISALVIGKVTA